MSFFTFLGEKQESPKLASAVLGILINFFLALLIIFRSDRGLGPYKYLLLSITILSLLYAFSLLLLSPEIEHTGYTFLVIARLDRFRMPHAISIILLAMYAGTYGSMFANVATHFHYRHTLIVGRKPGILARSSLQKVWPWLLIPLVLGTIWALITILVCGPNSLTDHEIKLYLLENLHLNAQDIVYIGPNLWNQQGNISWLVVSGLATDTIIIGASCATILVYLKKIGKFLFSRSSSSIRHVKLHKQLFWALIWQTIISGLLLLAPCVILFFSIAFPFLGHGCSVITLVTYIFPIINPLPTLWVVRCYRKAIVDFAHLLKRRTWSLFCRKTTPEVVVSGAEVIEMVDSSRAVTASAHSKVGRISKL